MKLKKQQKRNLGIFLVLVLAVILFFNFGLSNTLSVFDYAGKGGFVNVQLVQENSEYYTYNLKWDTRDPFSKNQASSDPQVTWDFSKQIGASPYDDPCDGCPRLAFKLPSDIQYETPFEVPTQSILISGIVGNGNSCGNPQTTSCPVEVKFKDLKATCTAKINNDLSPPNAIDCELKGTAYTPSGEGFIPYGDPIIKLSPNFYKIGQSPPITIYRTSENQCSQLTIKSSERQLNDYDTLINCQENIVIAQPEIPNPKGFLSWLSSLNDFIGNFFKRILGLSITGDNIVEPNTIHTYSIDMSVNPILTSYKQGQTSWQWGSWGLVDKNNNVIQSVEPESINGTYKKSVTITTPKNLGDYALVGIIEQVDATWDKNIGNWVYSESKIVNKEAIDLKSEYSISSPTQPTPSGFGKLIGAILDFFKKLFGG